MKRANPRIRERYGTEDIWDLKPRLFDVKPGKRTALEYSSREVKVDDISQKHNRDVHDAKSLRKARLAIEKPKVRRSFVDYRNGQRRVLVEATTDNPNYSRKDLNGIFLGSGVAAAAPPVPVQTTASGTGGPGTRAKPGPRASVPGAGSNCECKDGIHCTNHHPPQRQPKSMVFPTSDGGSQRNMGNQQAQTGTGTPNLNKASTFQLLPPPSSAVAAPPPPESTRAKSQHSNKPKPGNRNSVRSSRRTASEIVDDGPSRSREFDADFEKLGKEISSKAENAHYSNIQKDLRKVSAALKKLSNAQPTSHNSSERMLHLQSLHFPLGQLIHNYGINVGHASIECLDEIGVNIILSQLSREVSESRHPVDDAAVPKASSVRSVKDPLQASTPQRSLSIRSKASSKRKSPDQTIAAEVERLPNGAIAMAPPPPPAETTPPRVPSVRSTRSANVKSSDLEPPQQLPTFDLPVVATGHRTPSVRSGVSGFTTTPVLVDVPEEYPIDLEEDQIATPRPRSVRSHASQKTHRSSRSLVTGRHDDVPRRSASKASSVQSKSSRRRHVDDVDNEALQKPLPPSRASSTRSFTSQKHQIIVEEEQDDQEFLPEITRTTNDASSIRSKSSVHSNSSGRDHKYDASQYAQIPLPESREPSIYSIKSTVSKTQKTPSIIEQDHTSSNIQPSKTRRASRPSSAYSASRKRHPSAIVDPPRDETDDGTRSETSESSAMSNTRTIVVADESKEPFTYGFDTEPENIPMQPEGPEHDWQLLAVPAAPRPRSVHSVTSLLQRKQNTRFHVSPVPSDIDANDPYAILPAESALSVCSMTPSLQKKRNDRFKVWSVSSDVGDSREPDYGYEEGEHNFADDSYERRPRRHKKHATSSRSYYDDGEPRTRRHRSSGASGNSRWTS